KTILGYFSTSKKSGPRRWLSRLAILVSMDATSMTTDPFRVPLAATLAWPSSALNVPFTLITRTILVWNRIIVLLGSRIQDPVRDARLVIVGLLISPSSAFSCRMCAGGPVGL